MRVAASGSRLHDLVALLADVIPHAPPRRLPDRCPSPAGYRCWRWRWRAPRCWPCRPTRELAMPRMLSEGRLISSTSFWPPPSVRPSDSSRIRSRSISGRFGDGALFGIAERLDAVVEMVDQHAAVVVLHGRQQARQRHRRIRRPVAVMAAVQFVVGSVERDVDGGDAARAEDDLLAAALVHRTVADQPDVAGQQVLVLGDNLRQVRRAGFFLAFEDELDIGT